MQQRGILRDHRDGLAQALLLQLHHILPINENAPARGPIEMQQQVHEVDFPAPERPTRPIFSPGRMVSEISRSTGRCAS